MKHLAYFLLAGICAAGMCGGADFHDWAKTPPMGWNSWDSFGCTITEAQVKEQADAEAKLLKPFGWTMFTVDIQWYHDEAKGHDYQPDAKLAMDEWGRLLPGPKRFPSSVNGAGFKPLADYVHAKGLTFGIHIMRGIARQAVRNNTAIFGTTARAADIADTRSTCSWNPDMYGVDLTKPGAQEYYDSIAALYAGWGVDFIKCDDICVTAGGRRGFFPRSGEIRMLALAIEHSGRDIVLSLSPGGALLSESWTYSNYANMWRITGDFWDAWPQLLEMFERCEQWQDHVKPGRWPDCDMLPLGTVGKGFGQERQTGFSRDEQRTMMTLWCVFRSPLMLGAELTKLDAWTLSLITNADVLRLEKHGTDARQVSRNENEAVWCCRDDETGAVYAALFNLTDTAREITVPLRQIEAASGTARELWSGEETAAGEDLTSSVPAHGAKLFSCARPRS